ncbi:MAG: hypothetical protein WCG25_09370 [bacterium]
MFHAFIISREICMFQLLSILTFLENCHAVPLSIGYDLPSLNLSWTDVIQSLVFTLNVT